MNNPIIIGGCMRSGTSLLSAIIDTHKNIACGPETEFLIAPAERGLNGIMYKLRINYNIDDHFKEYEFNRYKNRLIKYPHVNEDKLQQIYIKSYFSRSAFAKIFFSQYVKFKGKKRWAEKSPGNTFYIRQLYNYYPDAYFIHIVRDFRDMYLSLKKYYKQNNKNLSIYRAAYYWNRNYDFIKQSRNLKSKVFILRFEDLLLDTKQVLEKMFRFLGEEFDNKCLEYYKYIHDSPVKRHIEYIRKPINKNNCFKYKKEMTRYEKKISKILCGSVLNYFDYLII